MTIHIMTLFVVAAFAVIYWIGRRFFTEDRLAKRRDNSLISIAKDMRGIEPIHPKNEAPPRKAIDHKNINNISTIDKWCPIHGPLGHEGNCERCISEGKNIIYCERHGYQHVEAKRCLRCASQGLWSGRIVKEAIAPNPYTGRWPE